MPLSPFLKARVPNLAAYLESLRRTEAAGAGQLSARRCYPESDERQCGSFLERGLTGSFAVDVAADGQTGLTSRSCSPTTRSSSI
jgi:hypothetical protein